MKFDQVIQILTKNDGKKIDLSENYIGSTRAKQLAKLLTSNSSVKKMYLTSKILMMMIDAFYC
jgi:hypothetical protein